MKLTMPGRVIAALILACAVAVGALVTTAAATPKSPAKPAAAPKAAGAPKPTGTPKSRAVTPLSGTPSDEQCRNGAVGPPLQLVACLNGPLGTTTYAGWSAGRSGSGTAHWFEGDFVPYRVVMPGLSAGEHTLIFHYSTVIRTGNVSYHALDYLGSYDETETTSAVSTPTHRNNNNPCFDVLGSAAGSGCTAPGTAPVPAATRTVPPVDLSAQRTACGARGLPRVPAQAEGRFSLFAPDSARAAFTDASYLRNFTQGGNCYTEMRVRFTLDAPGTAVLAFGGRIASQLDWGRGNVAAGTNGTYNLSFTSLNGSSAGLGNLTLDANAVAAPPALHTSLTHRHITAGTSISDLAVTAGGPEGTVTGHVQFQLCAGRTTGCPQGTGDNIGSPVPLTNGQAQSGPFGHDLPPGNYCVGVEFHTDGNSFYSSGYYGYPTNECFTVTRAEPSISTSLSPNPVTVDQLVHDTATLSGATSDASGTVEFHRFDDPAACQAATAAFPGLRPSSETLVSTHTVTGNTVGPSANISVSHPGRFYWAAFYSGDDRNVPAVSICQTEPLVVQRVTPSITTSLSQNPVAVDEPVHDTAALSGATSDAGGTVEFWHFPTREACEESVAGFPGSDPSGGTHVSTANVTNGVVDPSDDVSFGQPGRAYWAAFYSGDGRNAPAASHCGTEPLVVGDTTAEVSTTLSANHIPIDGQVRDTATLSGATSGAGGTVEFRHYDSLEECEADTAGFPESEPSLGERASIAGVTNGVVEPSAYVQFTRPGEFWWAAFYSGDDAGNAPSASICETEPLVVDPARPAVSTHLSEDPVEVDQPAHDTAALSGATSDAGGTVHFRYYTSASGLADCQADVAGFPGNDPSRGSPAGSSTVTNGALDTPSTNAAFSQPGMFWWAAFYSGDTRNAPAASNCATEPLVVTTSHAEISTELSDSQVTVDAPVHDTAELHGVTSDAAGRVDFRHYGSLEECKADTAGFPLSQPSLGSPAGYSLVENGALTRTSDTAHFSQPGEFWWAAFYSGDTRNAPAASDCATEPLIVQRADSSMDTALSDSQITVGGRVHDTAELHGIAAGATGSVEFRYYRSPRACRADAAGFPETAPSRGRYVSTSDVTGGGVRPSSQVTFPDAGTFWWAAFYSGDGRNAPAVSDCRSEPLLVQRTAPSVTTSLGHDPVAVGQPVRDTATLTGATSGAGGTVEFRYYDSPADCRADAEGFPETAPSLGTYVSTSGVTNGVVSPSEEASFPRQGTHWWAAFYSGDTRNAPAASGCETEPLVVQRTSPSLSTGLRPDPVAVGQPVRDTAVLHGATSDAGGTVEFRHYDSLQACQADAAGFPGSAPSRGTHVSTETVAGGAAGPSGEARFPRPGLHWWAAFYSGDTRNAPAASDCATEPVAVTTAGPDITIVKTASGRGFGAAGTVITYYYTVTNIGPVPLHAISVTDSRGLPVSCPAPALAPLETMTCTARHTVTAADVDRGSITNIGAAEGIAPDGTVIGARSTLRLPFTGAPLVPVTG